MGFGPAGSVLRWKLRETIVCLDKTISDTHVNGKGPQIRFSFAGLWVYFIAQKLTLNIEQNKL